MMLAHNALLWAQIAAIAFFGSLAITGFMRQAGLGDPADGRSAHSGVIPTSGGVGIIGGLGLALSAIALIFPNLEIETGFASVISLIFAIGLLGLVDDQLALGPKLKFAIMIVICAAAVRVIGPPQTFPGFEGSIDIPYWLGFSGAMLWLFVVMNVVNFMDGANGMIGLSLSIAFITLSVLGLVTHSIDVTLLSALLLMSVFGFLPYNLRRKAQIFCGDVGALTLGFGFAICVLFLVDGRPDANFHFIGPVLILPFLVDTILTILRRLMKRENILKAHNQHLYQRFIRGGSGHLTVSFLYAILALLCANLTLLGVTRKWFETPEVFLALLGAFCAGWFLLGQSSRNPRDNKPR